MMLTIVPPHIDRMVRHYGSAVVVDVAVSVYPLKSQTCGRWNGHQCPQQAQRREVADVNNKQDEQWPSVVGVDGQHEQESEQRQLTQSLIESAAMPPSVGMIGKDTSTGKVQ